MILILNYSVIKSTTKYKFDNASGRNKNWHFHCPFFCSYQISVLGLLGPFFPNIPSCTPKLVNGRKS